MKLLEGLILVAYPTLKTIEIIEGKRKSKKKQNRNDDEQQEDLVRWLAYWGIYGLWLIFEGILPNPGHVVYVIIKVMFFLFLMLP